MVSLKHYTNEFKKHLNDFINDYENNENELKRLDYKIIKELSNIIKDTTNFAVPFIPSKYKKYNENKSLDTFNFSIPVAFEFEFDSYSKDSTVSNYFESHIPHIIFKIPNESLDFFSSLIGNKIDGEFIFMVRKINNNWELPLKGISITEKSITDVFIFKSINFEMEVQKSKNLLLEANLYNKELLTEKIEDFSVICFNNQEQLFSTEGGLLVAESFLSKPSILEKPVISKTINDNKNGLFYLNTLYDFSIRFKGK